MSKLSLDDIYHAFYSINESSGCTQPADVLFNSVVSQFSTFDAANQQNLLNFLAEECVFFSKIPQYMEKIQALANQMLSADNLGNQTTAISALTKLWLLSPQFDGKEDKFKEFINMLLSKSNDSNLVPHLRNVYTQCLHEIVSVNKQLLNVPTPKLIENAHQNNAPNSFSQIAYELNGKSDEVKDFLDKRFWSMSPLEIATFSRDYAPNYPVPPNDPLLLFTSIHNGNVSKDTALSLINNPFSQFGTSSTIFGFKSQYEFEGHEVFTPFDNDDVVVNKVGLLAKRISTIESSPLLSTFSEKDPNSPIVSAVFNLARRFPASEVFTFYRRYYEKTEKLDDYWISLFNGLELTVQDSVRCFLVSYPHRRSAAIALISNENGHVPISCIDAVTKDDIRQLETLSTKSSPQISQKIHSKLVEFGAVKNLEGGSAGFTQSKPLLTIASAFIETNASNRTKVLLDVNPIPNLDTSLYGVSFKISTGTVFEKEEVYTLPQVNGPCQVRFELAPTRIDSTQLTVTCEFTAEDGTPSTFTLGNVNVDSVDLLSPSAVEFKTAWGEGEESLTILNTKFQQVVAAMNKTVIGRSCEREEGRIQAVLQTPTGSTVTIVAVNSGNQTVIHFRAPSITLLTTIDEFLHKLENLQ